MSEPWNTLSLAEALSSSTLAESAAIDAGSEDSGITITLADYGDMQVHIAVSGDQVFVSTLLCAASMIKDRAAFNDACLRLNPLNPLSNLGLQTVNGEDVYIIFGELSAQSSLANVVEEIEVLADNAVDAAQGLVKEHI